jgi:hypothetical protein
VRGCTQRCVPGRLFFDMELPPDATPTHAAAGADALAQAAVGAAALDQAAAPASSCRRPGHRATASPKVVRPAGARGHPLGAGIQGRGGTGRRLGGGGWTTAAAAGLDNSRSRCESQRGERERRRSSGSQLGPAARYSSGARLPAAKGAGGRRRLPREQSIRELRL